MLSVAGENMISLKGDIPADSGLLSWEGDMRIGVMPGDRPAGQFAGGGVGLKRPPVSGWVRVESNAQDFAGGSSKSQRSISMVKHAIRHLTAPPPH